MLAGAVGCLAVLVTLSVLVATGSEWLYDLDGRVGEPLVAWTEDHDTVEVVARAIQIAFSTPPVVAATLLVAIWLSLKGFRLTALWVVGVMLAELVTMWTMKAAFQRPRPAEAILVLQDTSFPSGHSSAVAAMAGIAIVLAQLFLRRRSHRRMVAVVAVLVALVVGLDRLLLGVHNLSDVLAGWSLGAFWVLAAAYVVDPAPRLQVLAPLPSPVPSTKRLAVILNPVKVEEPAAFRTLVDSMAAAAGWEPPVWHETTVADTGRSMAEAAAADGADLVIVCGGDGTVRTVCAELAGTGIPVGVVPAGTGNLLARNLELPLYLRGAVDVALNGQDRAIDLVKISGDGIGDEEHFLVMAGMGLDAAIMEGANEQIKAKVGWLAYVVSGLRNMMFPAVRLEVSVDGGEFTRHRARTVVVGNVGMLQGGLPLLPDATLDDGRLDLVLLWPRRFLSWLLVLARVLTRSARADETVTRMTGRTIVVRTSHPTPRQVDGDPIGAGTQMVCECLHGRLLVRVPR
jgi:YegS/Rv2252/BmrU family lipid kinase